MGVVLRDGKDPWTARLYGKEGRVVIEGEFTDIVKGETMEDEVRRLRAEALDELAKLDADYI